MEIQQWRFSKIQYIFMFYLMVDFTRYVFSLKGWGISFWTPKKTTMLIDGGSWCPTIFDDHDLGVLGRGRGSQRWVFLPRWEKMFFTIKKTRKQTTLSFGWFFWIIVALPWKTQFDLFLSIWYHDYRELNHIKSKEGNPIKIYPNIFFKKSPQNQRGFDRYFETQVVTILVSIHPPPSVAQVALEVGSNG